MINKIAKYSLLALMTSLAPMKYAGATDYQCPDPTKATCNAGKCQVVVNGEKWTGSLPEDNTAVELYSIDLSPGESSGKVAARCNFKTSADMQGDYDFIHDFPLPYTDCKVNAAKEANTRGGVKYT